METTSINFNGWFGESVLNGKKTLTGKAFYENEYQYPLTVLQTDKSLTLTIESMTFVFNSPLTKDPLQRFTNDLYELIVKKKTKNSKSYWAFVLHSINK